MSEWISVKEKMPDMNVKVLAINQFSEQHVCSLEKHWLDEEPIFFITTSVQFYPSHWQPLPEPPK